MPAISLRGWLYGDFHPGLKFQLGIPSWKKLQLYEKFQPGLKYNSFEEIENLEVRWNERRLKKVKPEAFRLFRLEISI